MTTHRAGPTGRGIRVRARRRLLLAAGDVRVADSTGYHSNALLEAALHSIRDGVLVVDGAGRFVLMNPAAQTILATDAEPTGPEDWQRAFGIFLTDGVTPCPTEAMPLVRALAGEEPGHQEFILRNATYPDGALITATAQRLHPTAGVAGGGALAVIRDVTAARLLQGGVLAEQNRSSRLLQALSDLGEGICIADDERVLFVNDAYANLTGYAVQDLVEGSPDTVGADVHAVEQFRAWRRAVAAAPGTPVTMSTRIRKPTGQVVAVETTGVLVTDAGSTYRVLVNKDLTERDRQRVELAQRAADLEAANRQLAAARDAATSASRAKSAFLATMSHEIRTPLNVVIGITEIVLDTALQPDQRELLGNVRLSGELLLSLINDLLDWSKIESGSLELEQQPFDLRDCVEGAVTLLASQTGGRELDLLVDIAPGCPDVVVGDTTRLRQILANLTGNAIKFTERGRVVVSVRPVHLATRPGEAGPDDVQLRFSVEDTGMGIATDKMDRLFRDFSQVDTSTTRTHGGTGLGLAISQRLAAAMGGLITVTSATGVGSTFTADLRLGLPSAEARAALEQGIVARKMWPALTGRRVLVVDDDPISRRILVDSLAGWGTRCAAVGSGAEALRVLAADADFGAAIVDFRMPGTAGPALLAAIGAIPTATRLPVVLLTSVSEREHLPSTAGRAIRTLTRPVREAELRSALTDLLDPGTGAVAVVAARETPRVPADDAPEPTTSPLRVLVVEDSSVNRTVAQLMLSGLGYGADIAVNGQDAVEAARRTPYDVILMDVQMPVMDGYEATRQLRREPPPGPRPWVIALTASALVEDREQCAAAGMDDYLSKPVRRADLADVLARAPRNSRTPATSGRSAGQSHQIADE